MNKTLTELTPVLIGLMTVTTAETCQNNEKPVSLDMNVLKILLDKLSAELDEYDTKAVDTIKKVVELTTNTPILDKLRGIADAVAEFDFEKATSELKKLSL